MHSYLVPVPCIFIVIYSSQTEQSSFCKCLGIKNSWYETRCGCINMVIPGSYLYIFDHRRQHLLVESGLPLRQRLHVCINSRLEIPNLKSPCRWLVWIVSCGCFSGGLSIKLQSMDRWGGALGGAVYLNIFVLKEINIIVPFESAERDE